MAGESAQRIVVGLSGGVDSAVAALLLVQQGYEVHGLYMHNWDADDAYCTSARDFQDARSVARELGIPLHSVNFAREYRDQVFEHFLSEHRAGRTPNPDVLCNREIKFGICLAYARRLGGTRFATGHYARIVRGMSGWQLHKGLDDAKDQSYFLHAVEREAFGSLLFPIGELDKADVRTRARAAGLPVHAKPDSTGICFIGERPFREFLAQHLPESPGPIETPGGRHIGTHRGLAYYTLGQRGGLEIGGRKDTAEAPWYVARKVATRNALVVVQGQEHELLFSRGCKTEAMHWLADPAPCALTCGVKLRYRQADQHATVHPLPGGVLRIEFERAQRAVTPGQFAVLYDNSRCLGGAVIDTTEPVEALTRVRAAAPAAL